MRLPKLSKFDLQIMEALWTRGACSIREVQESFPAKKRPAYSTVQTMVYRLEAKKAVQRARKIGNAHIFEAAISREVTQNKFLDELLKIFGGHPQNVMARLIESGKLTLEDVEEARKTILKLDQATRKDKS